MKMASVLMMSCLYTNNPQSLLTSLFSLLPSLPFLNAPPAATQYEAQEMAAKKEADLRRLGENLHHLVSTKHIRGVFNPPAEYLEAPTVLDVPPDDHIRGVVRDLLRTRGIAKTASSMVTDLNGTLKIPLKGLKNRLSLQVSCYCCHSILILAHAVLLLS